MSNQYYTHFMIYINNLSMYYVLCVLISIIAIIVTWYWHFKNIQIETGNNELVEKSVNTEEEINMDEKTIPEENVQEFVDMVPKLRNITKETIEKISASLTPEQLEAEKQAEQRQLSAILELLKKQEDKFQVGSMEELEGQLKLYR